MTPKPEPKHLICPACSGRPTRCRECRGAGAVTATRWMELMAKKAKAS